MRAIGHPHPVRRMTGKGFGIQRQETVGDACPFGQLTSHLRVTAVGLRIPTPSYAFKVRTRAQERSQDTSRIVSAAEADPNPLSLARLRAHRLRETLLDSSI